MISPSLNCKMISLRIRSDITLKARWYHLIFKVILSDITYNQDDITLKLDDIILRRGDITLNRGDIRSKARWYHILLINSKTAPHIAILWGTQSKRKGQKWKLHVHGGIWTHYSQIRKPMLYLVHHRIFIGFKHYLLWKLHTWVNCTNNASIGFDNKINNLI